jgi:hypothetical protein
MASDFALFRVDDAAIAGDGCGIAPQFLLLTTAPVRPVALAHACLVDSVPVSDDS